MREAIDACAAKPITGEQVQDVLDKAGAGDDKSDGGEKVLTDAYTSHLDALTSARLQKDEDYSDTQFPNAAKYYFGGPKEK